MFPVNGKQKQIAFIRERLVNDDRWLYRGILAIYARQTSHEQSNKLTEEKNGVGFNALDADILSSFAEGIKKYNHLTENQLPIARVLMPKYARQLWEIANERNR